MEDSDKGKKMKKLFMVVLMVLFVFTNVAYAKSKLNNIDRFEKNGKHYSVFVTEDMFPYKRAIIYSAEKSKNIMFAFSREGLTLKWSNEENIKGYFMFDNKMYPIKITIKKRKLKNGNYSERATMLIPKAKALPLADKEHFVIRIGCCDMGSVPQNFKDALKEILSE